MADNGLRKYIDNMMSKSSKGVLILLILFASITSTTGGCDSSIMKGLNISASYANYFHLNTATLALNTSCVWAGNAISDLFYGQITNALGRRCVMSPAEIVTVWPPVSTHSRPVSSTARATPTTSRSPGMLARTREPSVTL